jgi:hypothetical protein
MRVFPYFEFTKPLICFNLSRTKKKQGRHNMERRKADRRVSATTPPFPLLTVYGRIMDDRRKQPDRRINNIQALFLGVIDGDRQ